MKTFPHVASSSIEALGDASRSSMEDAIGGAKAIRLNDAFDECHSRCHLVPFGDADVTRDRESNQEVFRRGIRETENACRPIRGMADA